MKTLFYIIGIIVVIYLLIGFYLWNMSEGDYHKKQPLWIIPLWLPILIYGFILEM